MQTLTSTQKLLRQRSFFSSLIPLFALFIGLGASRDAMAQASISRSSLTISGTATNGSVGPTTFFGVGANPARPPFQGQLLGNFDSVTGELNITNAFTRVTSKASSETLANTGLFRYRVYLSSATALPNFTDVALPYVSGTGTNPANPAIYSANTAINLLANLTGSGTYTVEIRYAVDVIADTDLDGSGKRTLGDPGTPDGYKATFTVPAPTITPVNGTTTWISNGVAPMNTNWLNAANWSNGVPTRNSNAIIPERVLNVPTAFPILDNFGVYEVNNLTLVGQSNSTRGEVTVQQASLVVFGNLRQNSGGLRGTVTRALGVRNEALNSTLVLAGGNQVVTGRLGMPDVIIAGTGTKSITGVLAPSNTLSFQPANVANGVIVQSASEDPGSTGAINAVFDTTLQTLIDLGDSGLINQEAGYAETNTSYAKGVMRSDRLISSAPQTFGNIGLDVTANYTSVVSIIIFRIVGDPLQSPTSNNGVIAVPIKRQYLVDNALDSENPSFAGATLSFVFRYLDSADELNGIPEDNLTMFRSRSNGPPYAPVFGTLDIVNNTVTRNGLPSLSRFVLTLGDRLKPLPVTLTSFNAKRMGADVLVTWETASEINSKGFEVQVSTDGEVFRTLGSVASTSSNSAKKTSYRYVDTETNKVGTRYYRLRQIDIDGKDAFFAPRTVLFTGNALATAIVAYPNPIVGSELRLVLQSVAAGKGTLRITDMTGRVIRQESVELASGTSDLSVKALDDLKAGMYLVGVTLPTGEAQNLRIVKQ